MICPNCGSNMSDKRKRCDRCGTDLIIYRKIFRASNLLYNDGLAKARVRDLSGAVIVLRKSLDLNKLNTSARNLLGLVYYEMGETVAALSEWVISKHFQPSDNDADEYIYKVQSNLTRLDALNQAIKRYNTALNMAKQGSDDLAVIQLKKVVSLNANFIRAYQLLSLLIMKTGDTERAKRYLLKASNIDVSNTTTLRYLRELEASTVKRDADANPEAEQNSAGAIMPISSYREDKPNIIAYVNLVIGVIIGLALAAFLIIPTIKNNITDNDNTDNTDNGYTLAQIQAKDEQISELEGEIAGLEQEKKDLQTQLDNVVIPEDTANKYMVLFEAADDYITELLKPANQRELIPIADTLAGIDDSDIELEPAVTLLAGMREATYPEAAASYYDEGHDLYGDRHYQEALDKLAKAMVFDPADVHAIYFTARAYHRLNDTANAIKYYTIVITDFPDSNRASSAEDFLAELQ